MTEERDDLELLGRARALDPAIEPDRDLWPAVRAALEVPRSRRRRRIPLALAASLLAGIIAAALLFSGTPGRVDRNPVSADALLPTALDAELVATRARLIASLDEELADLSPESQAAVARSLKDIDEALANIRAQLDDHPNSELLLDLLVSTYTQQIALLGEMDGLARSVSRAVDPKRTRL